MNVENFLEALIKWRPLSNSVKTKMKPYQFHEPMLFTEGEFFFFIQESFRKNDDWVFGTKVFDEEGRRLDRPLPWMQIGFYEYKPR